MSAQMRFSTSERGRGSRYPRPRIGRPAVVLAGLLVLIGVAVFASWRRRNPPVAPSLAQVGKQARDQLLKIERYYGHVGQARAELLSGERGEAVSGLEEAVFSAIRDGVLPLRDSTAPTEGEMILVGLYRSDMKQGRSHERMHELDQFMRAHYSAYDPEVCESYVNRVVLRRRQDGGTGE